MSEDTTKTASDYSLWNLYLERWPLESLRSLKLEEYTNLTSETEDYLCHWLERRTTQLGSIRGGSASKFSLYKIKKTKSILGSGEKSDEEYVWWEKLGSTAEEAFAKIKESILSAAENASQGKFIEDFNEYPGSAIQMKIRFLYQKEPYRLLPIYSHDLLNRLSTEYLGRSCARGVEMIQANLDLREKCFPDEDPFEVMRRLCSEPKDHVATRRYWAGGTSWGKTPMHPEFIAKNEWRMWWKEDTAKGKTKVEKFLRYFKEIQIGDFFAMKAYGGSNDLKIHYIGTVRAKRDEDFALTLEPIEGVELFHGKGPKIGTGGSWFGSLTPVNSPEAIEKIFGIEREETTMNPSSIDLPLNLILYGPPGTGKTYKLQNEFFPKFTEAETNQTQSEFEESIVTLKSWWEIISATMLDLKTAKVGEILDHPLVQAKVNLSSNNNPRAAIWAQLQIHTKTDCPNVNYTKRIEPQVFFKDENSLWSIDEELAKELIPQASELLETWKNGPSRAEQKKRYVFTTFHQSYSYEDFIEGIKPVMADAEGELTYEIKEGVFKSIARQAERNPDKPHAIFIDEINRGNIAAIFGELITLIEDDKRLGAKSELAATLPYSRETFSVPPNLYIIGTMNTADRSVEALDTALRRRFSFQQMLPAPETIEKSQIEGVDLRIMLRTINDRIESLLDKDHTIGHAFFMACRTMDDLKQVFANKILPLLEEFFYNDTAKIGMVLGKSFVKSRVRKTEFARGNWDNGDFDDRETYKLENIANLGPTDFISIYDA